jgi:hypothetical protein
MPVQTARLANLRSVVRLLEQDGLVSRQAQVEFLGNTVTVMKLQAMLEGAHIGAMFAEHVEYALFKPRGWMSELHEGASTASDEASGLALS